jgi:hypothetical protein
VKLNGGSNRRNDRRQTRNLQVRKKWKRNLAIANQCQALDGHVWASGAAPAPAVYEARAVCHVPQPATLCSPRILFLGRW